MLRSSGLWISPKKGCGWEQCPDGSATSPSMTSTHGPRRSADLAALSWSRRPTAISAAFLCGRRSARRDLALVAGLTIRPIATGRLERARARGWHELLAEDRSTVFPFYGELLGWQIPRMEATRQSAYEVFLAAGQTIRGMLTKLLSVSQRVLAPLLQCRRRRAAARRVDVLAGAGWSGADRVARRLLDRAMCRSPRRPVCAAGGMGSEGHQVILPASEVSWSAKWGSIASQGRGGASQDEALGLTPATLAT